MNMTTNSIIAGMFVLLTAAAVAQPARELPETDTIPSSLMSFFVTSRPIGDGGNLGGLAGADAHCAQLAREAGAQPRNWRAYLSTQARPGEPAVNARDRIGDGPWYNSKERLPDYLNRRLSRPMIKSQIHGDTLLEAQRGSNMHKQHARTEEGEVVRGVGDPLPWEHALLTGSTPDGRAFPPGEDRTCNNWTSNTEGAAQYGHSDRIGNGNQSWNSAGTSVGCSQDDLAASGGVGLFYCFAID